MADVVEVAESAWYVVVSYVVAFLPWGIYSAVDHVDGRWRRVSTLATKTILAAGTLFASLCALMAYIAVQFAAEDWKEGMAAVVVLAASWLPIVRVSRQLWIMSGSACLGRVLGGISARKIRWDPCNSSNFYDNDRPGEGITDISLRRWGKEWLDFHLAHKALSSSTAALDVAGYEPSRQDYDNAKDIVRFRLRMVTARTGYIRNFRGHPEEGADNALKRLVWLFDNLLGHRELFESVLSLGLCVHACKLLCAPHVVRQTDFQWFNWLRGDEADANCVQNGHLEYCRMLLANPLEVELPDADYHEAYSLLPAERASRESRGTLKWQHVMYLVSSTLELHALTAALALPNKLEPAGTLEFVRQHVLGAVAGNTLRRGEVAPVGGYGAFVASDRTAQVFRSLCKQIDGQRSRWKAIVENAESLAQILTHSFKKKKGPDPAVTAGPVDEVRRVLAEVQGELPAPG